MVVTELVFVMTVSVVVSVTVAVRTIVGQVEVRVMVFEVV